MAWPVLGELSWSFMAPFTHRTPRSHLIGPFVTAGEVSQPVEFGPHRQTEAEEENPWLLENLVVDAADKLSLRLVLCFGRFQLVCGEEGINGIESIQKERRARKGKWAYRPNCHE
jgi:hypothetical protein